MTEIAPPPEVTSLHGLANYVIGIIKEETPDPVLFDLGCGKKKFPGFKGVDFYTDTDVQHDLFNGDWSFTPDNSVDMLNACHFVEHVQDLNGFMEKAWRKLKKGGYFLITTPYGLSVRAWQDPDHKRPIFRETYWYFNRESRLNMGVDHYEGKSNFDICQMWPAWHKDYATRAQNNPDLAEQFLKTWGAVDDLTVLLRSKE